MKGINAHRITIKVGELWQSPILHVLLTQEEDVIVARCLDFTISSHGKDEHDALNSLADSVKEYILTAVENNAIDTVFDPAHSKYWRMYNEIEAKQSLHTLKRSLKRSLSCVSQEKISQASPEINYA